MEHISHIWPRITDLAKDLGKNYQTVAAWKRRGNIPAEYDLDLIEAASARGQKLTLEELALARRSTHQPEAAPATSSCSPAIAEAR